eukprot:jgi/Mesvir1/26491/Mv16157-RA.1
MTHMESDHSNAAEAATVSQLVAALSEAAQGYPAGAQRTLTQEEYARCYRAWTRFAAAEYEAMVEGLAGELDRAFPSPVTFSLLDVGAGPASLAARLPARIRDRVRRFGAYEPHAGFAASLACSVGDALPLVKAPAIATVPFGEAVGAEPVRERWDVVLFSHSLYGMASKSAALSLARRALTPGGIVVILHRAGTLSLGLPERLLGERMLATVPNRDDDIDMAAAFLCGYILADPQVMRAVCRRLATPATPDGLSFATPVAVAVAHSAAYELSRLQVPMAPAEFVVKSRDARRAQPACVVRPVLDAHVQACVRWAVGSQMPLTVIGGGHAAHCVQEGIVAIDMSALDRVVVDPLARTVTAGAGATAGKIVAAAREHGLAVPLGGRPSVGAGLWLQGGVGHLTRSTGLTCDRITRLRVVRLSPDARVDTLDRPADLWHMLGAGTNFGVVLEATFLAVPFTDIALRRWVLAASPGPSSGLEAVLGDYARRAAALDHRCSADLYLMWSSSAAFQLSVSVSDTSDDAAASAQLLRDLPPVDGNDNDAKNDPDKDAKNDPDKDANDGADAASRVDLCALFELEVYMTSMRPERIEGEPPGAVDSFKRSLMLSTATLVASRAMRDELLAALGAAPSQLCYVHVVHAGGAARTPPFPNAFGVREWDLLAVVTGVWPRQQPRRREAVARWVYATLDRLLPFSAGVYGTDLGPDRRDVALACCAFGSDRQLSELAQLKRTSLDPGNVLLYACPILAADALRARSGPLVGVLVTGRCGAGKDYAAGVWCDALTDMFGGPGAVHVDVSRISDETKREYAAAHGADFDRLVNDRAYKEEHRAALTAFHEGQQRSTPAIRETHFLDVLRRSRADVLFVTGMREGSPRRRYASLAPCPLLHLRVCAPASAGEDGKQDGNGDEDVDLVFLNDVMGPEQARRWAWDHLAPRVRPFLVTLPRPTDPRIKRLLEMIACTPDYPRPGVNFRNVLGLVGHRGGLSLCTDLLAELIESDKNAVDVLACAEAGGFVFAGALAARLNMPLALARGPGKIPGRTRTVVHGGSNISHGYGPVRDMNGHATTICAGGSLEMLDTAIPPGARVVIVDDVLATGATLAALVDIVRESGAVVVCAVVVAEFPWHRGRDVVPGVPVHSLLSFPGE